MTPENFCYWLQGYFEISNGEVQLSKEKVQIIQDHLDLVFRKVTPDRKPPVETLTGGISLLPKDVDGYQKVVLAKYGELGNASHYHNRIVYC